MKNLSNETINNTKAGELTIMELMCVLSDKVNRGASYYILSVDTYRPCVIKDVQKFIDSDRRFNKAKYAEQGEEYLKKYISRCYTGTEDVNIILEDNKAYLDVLKINCDGTEISFYFDKDGMVCYVYQD